MRRIPLALLCLGICALGAPVPLTPAERQLNLDSFEYVWKTVRDSHWDPQLGGLDWSAVRDELRPKMEKAETAEQTREILRDMIGRLHQSHFSIIPSEVYGDVHGTHDGADGTAGFDVRAISGKALVTSVESGSPAASKGVHSGWEITAIEGAELSPILHRVAETYRNSTLRDLYLARAVLTRLDGSLAKKVRVEFLDGAGRRPVLDIARTPPRGEPARFGYAPVMHVWIETRKLESGIGYVAFNLFMDPARLMPQFEEAVKSCLQCDGMIIDLRGNTGGIAFMAMGMAGFFIDRQNQALGTMHMRQSPLQFFINPRLPFYGGPLAILVDGLSASTSEILAGGLKDLHRARIFGTRTAGAALPSVIEKLPNGDGFQYARASYVSEGGKPLEGIGVEPDVEAAPTREALLAGRDPALDAALQWIHARKRGNGNEK
ncbi:MAG: S41 family peptidase [Acidobacteriota bacterium]|nr:S41 family peptidase [Acidobacteriota bacterium]